MISNILGEGLAGIFGGPVVSYLLARYRDAMARRKAAAVAAWVVAFLVAVVAYGGLKSTASIFKLVEAYTVPPPIPNAQPSPPTPQASPPTPQASPPTPQASPPTPRAQPAPTPSAQPKAAPSSMTVPPHVPPAPVKRDPNAPEALPQPDVHEHTDPQTPGAARHGALDAEED